MWWEANFEKEKTKKEARGTTFKNKKKNNDKNKYTYKTTALIYSSLICPFDF